MISVIVVLCALNGSGCIERVATDSNMDPKIKMFACSDQASLAKWFMDSPYWATYKIQSVKCKIGNRADPRSST